MPASRLSPSVCRTKTKPAGCPQRAPTTRHDQERTTWPDSSPRTPKPANFPPPPWRPTALAELVNTETEAEIWKRARRETAHGLSVGDILFSSWGYDQTNVDFYEVVRVPSARSAVVRQIKQETTENSSSMSGVTVPKPGEFVSTAKESIRSAAG